MEYIHALATQHHRLNARKRSIGVGADGHHNREGAHRSGTDSPEARIVERWDRRTMQRTECPTTTAGEDSHNRSPPRTSRQYIGDRAGAANRLSSSIANSTAVSSTRAIANASCTGGQAARDSASHSSLIRADGGRGRRRASIAPATRHARYNASRPPTSGRKSNADQFIHRLVPLVGTSALLNAASVSDGDNSTRAS